MTSSQTPISKSVEQIINENYQKYPVSEGRGTFLRLPLLCSPFLAHIEFLFAVQAMLSVSQAKARELLTTTPHGTSGVR